MSGIIQTELQKTEPTAKQIEQRQQQLKQLLFTIKQQALRHGRERFYGYGEIAEISTPVMVAGKTITFVYRYDPLNDVLIPVTYA